MALPETGSGVYSFDVKNLSCFCVEIFPPSVRTKLFSGFIFETNYLNVSKTFPPNYRFLENGARM